VEYRDPANRRFHAQPTACPHCGPQYVLMRCDGGAMTSDCAVDAVEEAARCLGEGRIIAIKGLGGYHLACDATNEAAVIALRDRKFRKEKPFAVMVRDITVARDTVALTAAAEHLLASTARPIVLAPGRMELAGVAPGTRDLGVMLPYTPLHHLLFAYGAPDRLVMTSGNRSSEPIAYRDDDAVHRLKGIADAIVAGERPIARRVDDSVVRVDATGPVVLRRARGYAPGVVAQIPCARPVLAVGADLKNAVALVVDGQAIVSQHIGDLEHYDAFAAFRETVDDLLAMYAANCDDLIVAHDLHPQYASTLFARTLQAGATRGVQHHRAHIASVLAERHELDTRVVGVAFDGTGYGDDGSIWGGEFFVGSVRDGFTRIAHLRPAVVPGGDAAARFPVQAAAGFLAQLDALPDLGTEPFRFPRRYESARSLAARDIRSFRTTSAGRLFDTVAALLGFTRDITYEGQAAIWLEELARTSSAAGAFEFPFQHRELDWRPAINEVIALRKRGTDIRDVARMFHRGLAHAIAGAALELAATHRVNDVVLSGGVFQNTLLLGDIQTSLSRSPLRVLINSAVPPNDGGISLGQAAIAAFWRSGCTEAPHGDS
jgi:hydrogenase maturation protein HypF